MTSGSLLTAAEAFALPYYAAPGRTYHNETHVRAMLSMLEGRGVLTPTLALAVWGHDLVYDPRAKDNELRSADEFGRWLGSRKASGELLADVRRLILVTSHAHPPTRRDEALLQDADLAILGACAEEYAAYELAIRREYRQLPDFLYRLGRKRLLRGFLRRPVIYHTPEFRSLEVPARRNLDHAVRQGIDEALRAATAR